MPPIYELQTPLAKTVSESSKCTESKRSKELGG